MIGFLFADMVWRGSVYGGGIQVTLKLALNLLSALVGFASQSGLHDYVAMTGGM
jgi:hypothetical protein